MIKYGKKILIFIMDLLGLPKDTELTDNHPTISDVSVQSENKIVNPNQVRSGVTRGIQQLGSDKVYSDGGNNQIIVEDDTTPRVLMGDQATFGEGFYVSKSGINVKTNTDAGQFIFNSNQDTFKIAKTGTYTTSASFTTVSTPTGGSVTESFAHGLTGGVPIVLAYIVSSSIYYALPYLSFNAGATYQVIHIAVSSDTTNVYFSLTTGNEGSNWANTPIKYYLLQETAT